MDLQKKKEEFFEKFAHHQNGSFPEENGYYDLANDAEGIWSWIEQTIKDEYLQGFNDAYNIHEQERESIPTKKAYEAMDKRAEIYGEILEMQKRGIKFNQ